MLSSITTPMLFLRQHVRIAAVAALVLAAPHAGAQTRDGARTPTTRSTGGGKADTVSAAARSHSSVARAGVPGTYRIRICPTGCNPERPPVTGYLVLLRDTVRTASLSPDVLDVLSITWMGNDANNACFAFDHVTRPVETLAGIQRAGFTAWERAHADSVVVRLYASPDAGYHVTFVLRGGTLRGVGPSRGAGVVAFRDDERPDRVTGYRMGPPDPSICFRAGRREAARIQAMRDSAQ